MFEYTADNHFKFGYNNNWFKDRTNETDNWTIQYGQCKRPVKTWREENTLAAQRIYDQRLGLPIDILFSGGIDSEIVLRSFIDAKVPFNVHFAVYDGYNDYDYNWVKKICENLNIKFYKHRLDVINFWESEEAIKIANISKTISPQMLPQQWLMKKVDGLPILGNGECYTCRTDIAEQKDIKPEDRIYNNVKWVLVEREKIASWYRFAINTDRPAIPGFFQYTPEQVLSFLNDEYCLELHKNKIKKKLSNASSKFKVYYKYYNQLQNRDKKSGFEILINSDLNLRSKLNKKYNMYHYEYWSETDELIRYLIGICSTMPENLSKKIKDPGSNMKEFYGNIRI